jgi:hypothetical protein
MTAVETPRTTTDGPSPAPAAPVEAPVLRLRRLQEAVITLRIEGTTPVIPHKWSEKALQLMRSKQFGEAVRPAREPKNPQEEAHAATYWLPDGRPGMPAVAFKAAMVGACRNFEGISMTAAKTMFFVEGEGLEQLVPIEGEPVMREDTPRNAGGTVDLRYRNSIFPWAASIRVRFLAARIDAQSILALLDAAGRQGVGDWRPGAPKSHTGIYGQWRVVDPEAQEAREEAAR